MSPRLSLACLGLLGTIFLGCGIGTRDHPPLEQRQEASIAARCQEMREREVLLSAAHRTAWEALALCTDHDY
jgi:hypothetical protein